MSDERGVDCRFVRMSSSGDAMEVMIVRERMPAVSGTRVGFEKSGGSASRRR